MSESCASALAGKVHWPFTGLLDSPETNIGMGLFLAGGGAITNRTPYEYHFALPPQVLAESGAVLFRSYSRLPIPSLRLALEDWELFEDWVQLFGQANLQRGFSGIRILELPNSALPALALSQSFPNLESLVVELNNVQKLIDVLVSGNFPKLRTLSFSAIRVSISELRRLIEHPSFCITGLCFRMMNFGDEGLALLAEIPAISQIDTLIFEAARPSACPTGPTSLGLRILLNSPHLHLKRLAIKSVWNMGTGVMDALEACPQLETLEHLELADSQSEQDVARLFRHQKLPKLAEVRLVGTSYDDNLLESLAQNSSLASLRRVVVELHPNVSADAVATTRVASHLRNTVIVYDIRE